MVQIRICSLLTILLFSAAIQAIPGKEINWKEEIDGLKRELNTRHPDLYFSRDSTSFCRELDQVADHASGKSILGIAVELQQVVATLGDPNTVVNYHYHIDTKLILPFECYWFEEGIYVMKYWEDFEALAGKRLVSINNFPVQQVIDSLSTLISGATPARVRSVIPRMITWSQILDHFGFAEESLFNIEVENQEGKSTTLAIKLPTPETEHIKFGPKNLPLGWEDTKTYFRDSLLSNESIYYIQYNKCWSREAEEDYGSGASALFMPSFKVFEKRALKTLKKNDIKKLVFDLRFNNGGQPLQFKSFVNKLEKTGIEKQATVYLLVGRKTASAAIINALDLMSAFDVVSVGENTGGRPNHFAGVSRFVMTTSNLIVSYSTEYVSLVEGNPESLSPSIPAPDTFREYVQGLDPGLEAIRHHTPR